MGYRREFENEEPIDETLVVLDLLADRRMGSVSREIVRTGRGDNAESYVEIGHHHDFSDSSFYRFKITERVVESLVTGNLVKGKPEWGYTDMKRRVVRY